MRRRRRLLKIMGVLIIVFSAIMIALNLSQKTDATAKSVSALRCILEHAKNMIDCYSLPASEILCGLDFSLFSSCGYSKNTHPLSFEEFVKNANILDKEADELMRAFAEGFGKGYRRDELLRCSSYLEKMRSREQKLIKEAAKKKNMIFTVAICASLAVVILII